MAPRIIDGDGCPVNRHIRGIDGHQMHPVPGWQACATAPDAITDPTSSALAWGVASDGPSLTAAETMRKTGT